MDVSIRYSPKIERPNAYRDSTLTYDDLKDVVWHLRVPGDYLSSADKSSLVADVREHRLTTRTIITTLFPEMTPARFCNFIPTPKTIIPDFLRIELGPPVVGQDNLVPHDNPCREGGTGPFAARHPELDFDGFEACRHWGIFTFTQYWRGQVGNPPVLLTCGNDRENCAVSYGRDGLPVDVHFKQRDDWEKVLAAVDDFLSAHLTKTGR